MSLPEGAAALQVPGKSALGHRRGATNASVTLADVLARSVPIAWFEAVAIVQEICSVVTKSGADGAHIPELAGIAITESGNVLVDAGGRQADAVSRAARMLGALLTDPGLPVKLRFLLVQVTSPSTAYPSLAEFSKDLAFFERPGRNDQIREVFNRWRATSSDPTAAEHRDRPKDEPQAQPPPDDQDAARTHARGRAVAIAAVLAVGFVVVVGLAGIALWMKPPSEGDADPAEPGLVAQTKAVATKGLDWAGERLGLGRLVSNVPPEPLPAPPEPRAVSRATGGTASGGARTSSARRESAATTAAPAPVRPSPPVPTPDLDAALEEALVRADVVYSSDDLDVQPPIMVRPQLPADLALDSSREDVASMDIWVSDSGEVLFVQLRSGPTRMSHTMLLSAAKAWRFEPAMKDGEPVVYRLTKRWVVVP